MTSARAAAAQAALSPPFLHVLPKDQVREFYGQARDQGERAVYLGRL